MTDARNVLALPNSRQKDRPFKAQSSSMARKNGVNSFEQMLNKRRYNRTDELNGHSYQKSKKSTLSQKESFDQTSKEQSKVKQTKAEKFVDDSKSANRISNKKTVVSKQNDPKAKTVSSSDDVTENQTLEDVNNFDEEIKVTDEKLIAWLDVLQNLQDDIAKFAQSESAKLTLDAEKLANQEVLAGAKTNQELAKLTDKLQAVSKEIFDKTGVDLLKELKLEPAKQIEFLKSAVSEMLSLQTNGAKLSKNALAEKLAELADKLGASELKLNQNSTSKTLSNDLKAEMLNVNRKIVSADKPLDGKQAGGQDAKSQKQSNDFAKGSSSSIKKTELSEDNIRQSQAVKKVSQEEMQDLKQTFEKVFTDKVDKTSKSDSLLKSSIINQIKAQISEKPLKVGETSQMTIRLRPEKLGKVEIKIKVHQDTVIAKLNVESHIVKETIESNLADLKSSLKDKGFSDMSFSVDVGKGETQQNEKQSSNKKIKNLELDIDNDELVLDGYQKSLESSVMGSSFEHLA